jgi:hypothetical protein
MSPRFLLGWSVVGVGGRGYRMYGSLALLLVGCGLPIVGIAHLALWTPT